MSCNLENFRENSTIIQRRYIPVEFVNYLLDIYIMYNYHNIQRRLCLSSGGIAEFSSVLLLCRQVDKKLEFTYFNETKTYALPNFRSMSLVPRPPLSTIIPLKLYFPYPRFCSKVSLLIQVENNNPVSTDKFQK